MVRNGYIGEVIRALAVLALVFFNFAHAPMTTPAPDGSFRVAAFDSICSDLSGGESDRHAPCHACRIGGGADLPAPTGCTETARAAAILRYSLATTLVAPGFARAWPAARGPPRLG